MDYFLSHATEPKELIVFDEAGHTGGWKMAPEVYQATIIRFFAEALLQP